VEDAVGGFEELLWSRHRRATTCFGTAWHWVDRPGKVATAARTHQGARLATEMLPRDLGVHTALGDEKPWSEVDPEALNDISRIIGLDRLGYLERGGSLVISVWTDDAQGRPIGEPAGHSSGLSMSPSKIGQFVRVRCRCSACTVQT
jgi:hypothetical protein